MSLVEPKSEAASLTAIVAELQSPCTSVPYLANREKGERSETERLRVRETCREDEAVRPPGAMHLDVWTVGRPNRQKVEEAKPGRQAAVNPLAFGQPS